MKLRGFMRDGWVRALLCLVSLCGGTAVGRAGETQLTPCNERQFGSDTGVVTYRGTVSDSVYLFSVTIPPGVVGYGNTPVAPFHGFRIFLNDYAEARACLFMMIGISMWDIFQYDFDEKARKKASRPVGRRVMVGNREGRRVRSVRRVNGEVWLSTEIWVSLPRQGSTDVWSVQFWRRKKDPHRVADEKLFTEFLGSLRFY